MKSFGGSTLLDPNSEISKGIPSGFSETRSKPRKSKGIFSKSAC